MMMILTAKVDFKKILLILAAAAAAIFCVLLLLGRGQETASVASEPAPGSNESRIRFLQSFGWEVTPSPVESSRVRIPGESGEVFRRYNLLQKGQGYDLTEFSGKKVMRYVYEVRNYPGAVDPVYATLLVFKNRVIGGDVTNTGVNGQIRGFRMPVPADTDRGKAPTVPGTLPAEETYPAAPAPDAMG